MHTKTRKRFVLHMRAVFTQLARDLHIDPCDLAYILRRLSQEGVSFATKVLPAFSKYALMCCEAQRILHAPSVGLTHFQLKGRSPCFMQGLLIDAVNGSASALSSIRQICDYFYKTTFKFDSCQIRNAEEKYIATDAGYNRESLDWDFVDDCRRAFINLFPVLSGSHPHEAYRFVRPHDGPGAFAGSSRLPMSFGRYKKLPTSVIGSHPDELNAFSGYFRAYPSSPETIKGTQSGRIAEMLFVPKDSRGPRTISKEPYFFLKAQMAFGKYMAHTLTIESNNRVNFKNQEINQALAKDSSLTRKNATLDLKDASDRVWYSVVQHIVRDSPALRYAVANLRSTHVSLPSGEVIRLNKLANMGSGICFPFLAMIVYLAAVVAIANTKRISLKEAGSLVYVYGDDLIVPVRYTQLVKDGLRRVGLEINQDKTFIDGYFRESCGGDYYHGQSVAPVRLKLSNASLGTVREYRNGFIPLTTDASIIQIEAHCRELRDAHLHNLADYYYNQLERRLGDLPIVARESNFLGKYHPDTPFIPPWPRKASYGVVKKEHDPTACPYKGLGQSFNSVEGLVQDWCLTPVRRQLSIRRRVPEHVELACWGLPQLPEFIKN